uniref:ATP synthase complex subunit 8 n=1 Tax=Macrohyliota sp. 2 MJ-2020 TaxID=2762521 RepID=A0A7G7MU86_9CUCU|nr:ATP synthase F0 subunit 8 [Macrohyliota sp. 2 MJ-2020]
MPQMAPLSWLTLFLIFSLTFLLYNCLIYYSFKYKNFFLKNKIFKKTIIWKW